MEEELGGSPAKDKLKKQHPKKTEFSVSSLLTKETEDVTEVMEPSLTYECLSATVPFETIYQSEARKKYPLQDLSTFPEDYIVIEKFPKLNLEQAGHEVKQEDLVPYVKVCFDTFSSDWTLVRTNVSGYNRKQSENINVYSKDLPLFQGDRNEELPSNPQTQDQKAFQYAILQDPENPLKADDLHFQLKMNATARKNKSNKSKRKANCDIPVFECFDPAYEWNPGTEIALCNRIRKTLRPDTKHDHNKPFHFTVEPKSVIFQFGDLEPFFCSLSLFDIGTNKKISENFFFQVNSPATLALLGDDIPKLTDSQNIEKALFSVRRRTANVFLVLQIYKVLHGDAEVSIDPYSKVAFVTKQKDLDKLKGKIQNEATDYCSRFGRFRQPFAISALQVFDAKGALLLTEKSDFSTLLSRTRDDIYTVLQSIAGNDVKKIGRDMRGMCTVVVHKVSDLSTFNVYDSSLRAVGPNKEGEPVLQIHEFLQQPRLLPNFSYVNNMYLYPLSANLGKITAKSVCIKIEIRENDNFDSPALTCFYSPSQPTGFVNKVFSSVEYHSKSPSGDEFKIRLPPKLSKKHHILFSFLDIPVGTKGKKKESNATIVAYAIVPLFENGKIVVHNSETFHSVPIVSKLEPIDYIAKATVEGTSTKAALNLQIQLESTIYPEDSNVTDFLNLYCESQEQVSDKELIASMKKLQQLSERTAIQYLSVIISSLLEVMCNREDHTLQLESFRALVIVLHKVTSKLKERVPRNSLLELYSNYLFNQTPSGKPVYTALCSNFLLYMMDKKYQRGDEVEEDSIFVNSWFFFDLVIKSMIIHLQQENKLNQDDRTALFDDFFARTLSRLLVNLTKYFKEHMFTSASIRVLNKNLALFMKDLLDVLDRGIVLDMIRSYLTEMTDPALKSEEEKSLCAEYKFEFLRIITDHESYVLLNLPFIPLKTLRLTDLTSLHPIAFTIIFEVIQALKSPKEDIWEVAIGTLYDILAKSANDGRIVDSEHKQVVACIHFVLIPMILDNWSPLSQFRQNVSQTLKRELYICVLYILENISSELIRDWWCKDLPHIQVSFLRLHADIVRAFTYNPDLIRPTKTLLTPQVALFMKETGTEEMNDLLKGSAGSKLNQEDEKKRLRWLTIRVDFLLLDILENYVSAFREQFSKSEQENSFVFGGIVESYCALSANKPNELFIPRIYNALHDFIRRYRKIIFLGENNYLRQLLQNIILHCNCPDSYTFIRATTLLYTIFQLNQRTLGNFSRARIQTVTTLSDLVASRTVTEDLMLNHSFRRLVYYALHSYVQMETEILASKTTSQQRDEFDDEETMAEFTRNIQEIVLTLASILRDTLRVAQLPDSGEPHMKMDLYHQIADGYKNAPDLRITWLNDLSTLQLKHGGIVEAGMAHLQCAIIIAEYLLSSGKIEKHLVPWEIFRSVFPIAQEFGECSSEEAVCQSNSFTVNGLLSALQLSVKYFIKGEYYEYAAQIYKIICPILEYSQSYRELATSYTQLQKCWSCVNDTNTERLFGKYFRVGFYGEKFGDLNGTQYIYKEPKLTHILEMSERLKDFYSQQTADSILTLDASKSIDSLDNTKCYMQITHMEPFRTSGAYVPRNSFFEKNTKLSEFMYETPFTLSGKAHAEHVSDQYKRKTVLVVTDSFPHLLTRLPVASKYEIIVSPLENAIEDIEKRNIVLETEISSRNPKTLRQVLQGSVRLQVNEGAVAVCKIFLGNYKEHPKPHILQLCDSISTFLTLCRVALAQNKSFIGCDDDRAFQQAMQSGFEELEPAISLLLRKVVYDVDDDTSETNTGDDDSSIDTPEVTLRVRKKTSKSHRRSRSMDQGSRLKKVERDLSFRDLPSDDYQPLVKISKAQISAKNTPSHPVEKSGSATEVTFNSSLPKTPDPKRRLLSDGPLSPRRRSSSSAHIFQTPTRPNSKPPPPAVPPRRPSRKNLQ